MIRVSERTGFPEILDGRVKTLHPRVHAGILARQADPAHRQTLAEHDIGPIELVVANLYPFSRTAARPGVSREEAIEQIDIGGPTLVRAAAKNSDSVTIVVDPGDYPRVVAEMKAGKGSVPLSIRQELATKAFQQTAAYDASIATWMEQAGSREEDQLPAALLLNLKRRATLRYGRIPTSEPPFTRPDRPRGTWPRSSTRERTCPSIIWLTWTLPGCCAGNSTARPAASSNTIIHAGRRWGTLRQRPIEKLSNVIPFPPLARSLPTIAASTKGPRRK